MLPPSTLDNISHGGFGTVKAFCYRLVCDAFGVKLPNASNVSFHKSCISMLSSPSSRKPILSKAILDILLSGARPQVFWIYAASVVACVTNFMTVWNFPLPNLISKAMSKDWFVRRKLEPSVTPFKPRAMPFPTPIVLADKFDKPLDLALSV